MFSTKARENNKVIHFCFHHSACWNDTLLAFHLINDLEMLCCLPDRELNLFQEFSNESCMGEAHGNPFYSFLLSPLKD